MNDWNKLSLGVILFVGWYLDCVVALIRVYRSELRINEKCQTAEAQSACCHMKHWFMLWQVQWWGNTGLNDGYPNKHSCLYHLFMMSVICVNACYYCYIGQCYSNDCVLSSGHSQNQTSGWVIFIRHHCIPMSSCCINARIIYSETKIYFLIFFTSKNIKFGQVKVSE